jgi:hypothetical protein
MSPAADTISENLGNYYRPLINAQACQLLMYSLEVVDSEKSNAVSMEEQRIVVSRLSHHSDQSYVQLAETLEDRVRRRELVRAVDHGYGSSPTRHYNISHSLHLEVPPMLGSYLPSPIFSPPPTRKRASTSAKSQVECKFY